MRLARRFDIDRGAVQQDGADADMRQDRAVDIDESRAVGKHGNHRVAAGGGGRRAFCHVEAGLPCSPAGGPDDVMACDMMSRVREIARHRRTHVAKADESDLAHLSVSSRCKVIVAEAREHCGDLFGHDVFE